MAVWWLGRAIVGPVRTSNTFNCSHLAPAAPAQRSSTGHGGPPRSAPGRILKPFLWCNLLSRKTSVCLADTFAGGLSFLVRTAVNALDAFRNRRWNFFLRYHLTTRWKDVFKAQFDVLLYDLTSTHFESHPPFAQEDKRR